MTKLYIREYESPQGMAGFPFPVGDESTESGFDQVVDYTAGVTSSVAFRSITRLVRLHTDAICSVAFGPNPTATTSNQRMAAGQTEYKFVRPGDKVSAVTNT